MQRASTSSLSVMISLQMKHSIMLTIFFFCWCYRALEICSLTCCPLSPTACSSPSSLFSRSASLNIQVSIYCFYALAWIILSWFSFFCWLVPPPNLSGLYCVCLSTAMDNGRSYSCICTHIYWPHCSNIDPQFLVLVCSLPPCSGAPCLQMVSSRAAVSCLRTSQEESPWPERQAEAAATSCSAWPC